MTEKRLFEYDKAYMKMAYAMANLSYAFRHKVGCIIVSPAGQVISQGFNGTPVNMSNVCEVVADENGNIFNYDNDSEYVKRNYQDISDGKIPGLRLITKDIVLHAESNAISKCSRYNSSTDNATLYVTLSPCVHCAKLIIQAGIKRVVMCEMYHDTSGIKILLDSGIQVDQIDFDSDTLKNISAIG